MQARVTAAVPTGACGPAGRAVRRGGPKGCAAAARARPSCMAPQALALGSAERNSNGDKLLVARPGICIYGRGQHLMPESGWQRPHARARVRAQPASCCKGATRPLGCRQPRLRSERARARGAHRSKSLGAGDCTDEKAMCVRSQARWGAAERAAAELRRASRAAPALSNRRFQHAGAAAEVAHAAGALRGSPHGSDQLPPRRGAPLRPARRTPRRHAPGPPRRTRRRPTAPAAAPQAARSRAAGARDLRSLGSQILGGACSSACRSAK